MPPRLINIAFNKKKFAEKFKFARKNFQLSLWLMLESCVVCVSALTLFSLTLKLEVARDESSLLPNSVSRVSELLLLDWGCYHFEIKKLIAGNGQLKNINEVINNKKKILELEMKGSSEMGCYLRDENSFS